MARLPIFVLFLLYLTYRSTGEEEFTEELLLRPLPDRKVLAHFHFQNKVPPTNSYGRHHHLVPKAIYQLVSVDYGLCEMLNKEALRLEMAPKDGNFAFNILECEAILPAGTVDDRVERVYQELPKWEESVGGARDRCKQIIKALADKYPSENLLLVTHGEGVGVSVSVSAFMPKNVTVYEVEYCAYSQLQRKISFGENKALATGEFEALMDEGQTTLMPPLFVGTLTVPAIVQ